MGVRAWGQGGRSACDLCHTLAPRAQQQQCASSLFYDLLSQHHPNRFLFHVFLHLDALKARIENALLETESKEFVVTKDLHILTLTCRWG